jgi:hypothetical protein
MRLVVVVVTAVVFAAVGPRLGAPRDRAAGEPFAYEPPEGFTLDESERDRDREWVHAATPGHVVAPRIHLTPSNKGGTVE